MADRSAIPPVSPTPGIPAVMAVYYPNAWPDDPAHWLNSDEYGWFKQAWAYASTQTNAIPALSKVSPAEMFWAIYCLDRGRAALRDGPPGEPQREIDEALMVACGPRSLRELVAMFLDTQIELDRLRTENRRLKLMLTGAA